MAENWRKTNVLHLHFRSIFHPDQRYIGSTSDLKSRLAIRRFFLLAKISGVQRSGRRMPSVAYTLCSNQPTYLPKFANLNFLEDTTPSATLQNVILRF